MSIKKYTNIDAINSKADNEGKFLQSEDLFIVSKNEIEDTDFGDCKYDVMEVSVYDINNNLLPQKSGNDVAYVKRGDIKNYMYQLTNKGGQKELAINVEKLLKDIGFTNGILKVNINFVRYRVGSENELTKVWVHEISPSREEIRILPLKTKDENINNKTKVEFNNLQNLNKDFKYYRKSFLDSLNSFEGTFLESIDSSLETQFGKDFFNILKKDFGLTRFADFRKKIYEDFKNATTYYLTNRYYSVSDSSFGKPSETRFDDCEQYDFNLLVSEIQKILFDCIDFNSKSLRRRNVDIKKLPTEFAITELRKEIQNNVDTFPTPYIVKRNVYSPDRVDIKRYNDNVGTSNNFPKDIKTEVIVNPPIEQAPPPTIDIEPIKILPPPPIEQIILPEPPTPTTGGGGGGGSIYREYDTLDRQNLADGGMGRERIEYT
jgi:hypothetical protein